MKIFDVIANGIKSAPPSTVGEAVCGLATGLGMLLILVAGSKPEQPEIVYKTVEVVDDADANPEEVITVKAELIDD
jgi:hypothetical protein